MTFLKALFRVLFPSFNIGIKPPSRVTMGFGELGKGPTVGITATNGNTSEKK
ncbi:hypothetical protein [Sporosarcina sp. FSL K6-1508]|uniref:hypothetical protein n=1 Tax=Sporosarcina sp. FSL K6-1508 TaxID=2921553 RepID=UPI0030F75EF0